MRNGRQATIMTSAGGLDQRQFQRKLGMPTAFSAVDCLIEGANSTREYSRLHLPGDVQVALLLLFRRFDQVDARCPGDQHRAQEHDRLSAELPWIGPIVDGLVDNAQAVGGRGGRSPRPDAKR